VSAAVDSTNEPGRVARMRLLVPLACVVFTLPLAARQRYDVQAPETIEVAGKKLTLVGMGLRKKSFFKVYLASNYVEEVTTRPEEVIRREMVKRVELHMLRGVDKNTIVNGIREGFQKNSNEQLPALQGRLQQFEAAIPDLNEGDKLAFTYVPGQGLTVALGGKDRARIPGKDFADALWSVWLGRNPVDEGLRAEMTIGAGVQQ
jgi:hypothetical protein